MGMLTRAVSQSTGFTVRAHGHAVVFATNGSGGGDTKAAAGTAMRDARKS